ncbi:MAG: hypothetical protein ABL914_10800 [Novosphingobium sp.]|uniref:hypothetical protein n=1 Tax=Novosphingobium sp. TaxID=1874826 RepID=UPI0032BAA0FD
MPQYWKSKTLLAKIEGAYGTDSVPTAGANAILATDVTLSPMEGQDVARNLERPAMGAEPMIPVGIFTRLTFSVEAVGSGALGTAPAWGPLLRMCALAEVITPATKVEYNPISDNHESGSIYMAIDGVRHVVLGTKGNASLKVGANGIPMWQFTMTGLFSLPTDQAKVTPDFTAWQAPQVATKLNTPTFTIGATPFVLRDFELDLGCQVEPRMLIGTEAILIVDRNEKLRTTVEATNMAAYNPYTIAQNQTLQALQLIHGTVASKRVKIDVASAQQGRLTGLSNNQNIVEWPLDFVPQQVAGNDQFKITLA